MAEKEYNPSVTELSSGGEEEAELDSDIFKADSRVDSAFAVLLELGRSTIKAERLLQKYAESEKKIAKLLQCPQSSDKHAEGPYIRDHYRCILVALEAVKAGLLDSDKMPECLEMKGYEQEWDNVLAFIKQNPDLMLVFALSHDLGKEDFVGFYAKKPAGKEAGFLDKHQFHGSHRNWTPKDRAFWKKQYRDLYEGFAAQHNGMPDAEIQRKFFDTYGISVTYIGHEKGLAIPENRATTDRLIAEKGLDEDASRLLDYSVLYHVTHYMGFEKGAADYDAMVLAADEAGVDRTAAVRSLQAGMIIDGILGARKRQDGNPDFFIATDTMRKFFDAERAHPEYLKEQEAKKNEKVQRGRIKLILIEQHLGGDDLVALKIPTTVRGKIVDAMYNAIGSEGELNFPEEIQAQVVPETRTILVERVRRAWKLFQTSNK